MVGLVVESWRARKRRPAVRSGFQRGYDERLDVLATSTLEVALCLIAGDSVREIAVFLGLSPSTVRRRVEDAKAQLGCASVDDLRRSYRFIEQVAA
jgi:DNA-binding NarL/FixJ family response regulator